MAVKGVVGGMGLICTRDHVFFVRVAQLLPCLQDMNLADWSMVVFWNESAGSGSQKGLILGWISRTSLLHRLMCCSNRRLYQVMIWTMQIMLIRIVNAWG